MKVNASKINIGWHWITRCTHWTIAILFFLNYFFTEPGYEVHIYIGWTIFGLVLLRVIWGTTFAKGPNHIKNFIPTKSGLKTHLSELKTRQAVDHIGHNAFGSFAIFLIWACLLAAAFTGWLQDTDWGFDNGVDDWHESIVDFLWILAVIHILAVIFTSIWLRRNLIKQMIVGK